MKILWAANAWEDYHYWLKADRAVFDRLNALIRECARTPFRGTGKPESLRGDLKGWWSRRITQEDRLVYRVRGTGEDQQLEIAQCRLHY